MTTYKVAHLREQGQNMIIIPLDQQPSDDQIDSLQYGASSAGLAGTVVPVWRSGSSFRFIAPQPWHPFFRGLSWNFIIANLNKRLTIG